MGRANKCAYKVRPMKYTLGQRVTIARKDAKLSQGQLGKALGITQSAVSQLEGGDATETKFLFKIARATQHRWEWLANEEGEPKADPLGIAADFAKLDREAQKELMDVAKVLKRGGR